MKIIHVTTDEGIVARRFDLEVGPEIVPGMHWIPVDAAGPHATVCIAHGGFQHKLYGNVPELALQLVRNLGIGVVALDAPNHGDRIADKEAAAKARDAAVRAARSGARRAMDPQAMQEYARRIQMHVGEWKALLDALEQDARWAKGPFGWWGVSMGTSHGIPMLAQDARIRAAVLGLNALAPGNATLEQQARSITIPLLFLNQSDDELMTREAALALWDTFGSKEKTMHINPGGHVQVPLFERKSSEEFFRRHLVQGAR